MIAIQCFFAAGLLLAWACRDPRNRVGGVTGYAFGTLLGVGIVEWAMS